MVLFSNNESTLYEITKFNPVTFSARDLIASFEVSYFLKQYTGDSVFRNVVRMQPCLIISAGALELV